jgi:hypothetical protein
VQFEFLREEGGGRGEREEEEVQEEQQKQKPVIQRDLLSKRINLEGDTHA